jgi:hypothetical protein
LYLRQPEHKPKQFFKDCALIFLTFTGGESSLPMKHAKKYRSNIFDYEGHNPWYSARRLIGSLWAGSKVITLTE